MTQVNVLYFYKHLAGNQDRHVAVIEVGSTQTGAAIKHVM